MRSTHTYAVLEISRQAYAEIRAKLEAADYGHAFNGDTIDMHGIALEPAAKSDEPEGVTVDAHGDLHGSAEAIEQFRSFARVRESLLGWKPDETAFLRP